MVGLRFLRFDPGQKKPPPNQRGLLVEVQKGEESNLALLIENAKSTIYRKLGLQRGQIQLECDLRDTAVAAGIRYGVLREQTASTSDVGLRNERRQTVCTEAFRLGDAPHRRGDLRIPHPAFQRLSKLGADMLKLLSAVVAAAGIAGVLTLLPVATSARLAASPPAKSEQAPLAACADRPWPYLNCIGSPREESRLQLLTADRFTPSASMLRVSDAQILLEKSQMQDW